MVMLLGCLEVVQHFVQRWQLEVTAGRRRPGRMPNVGQRPVASLYFSEISDNMSIFRRRAR